DIRPLHLSISRNSGRNVERPKPGFARREAQLRRGNRGTTTSVAGSATGGTATAAGKEGVRGGTRRFPHARMAPATRVATSSGRSRALPGGRPNFGEATVERPRQSPAPLREEPPPPPARRGSVGEPGGSPTREWLPR